MVQPFIYKALPTRVIFGRGKREAVKAEAGALGLKRPLVVTGKQQSAQGAELAAKHGWPHWDGAKMHTPVEVTEAALAFYKKENADGVIAVGGGSSIGLGKAIALCTDCPQLCLPTTYAGSEMTNILGETAAGAKTTKRDAKIQPETVIYDADLVGSLPATMAATSGMNAIAHAVEGLYAVDGNPIISLMAEEGIAALAEALPAGDTDKALYGAWLCGTVLGSVSMALHHKLCHVLGGTFNLPHAETHTVVLPHAVAYNAPAAPEAMMRIMKALGAKSAAGGLYDLAKKLNAPTSLKELGMLEDGLDKAADMAVAAPYPNPRALDRAALRQLFQNAYDGRRPAE